MVENGLMLVEVVAPGAFIEEELEARGWNQADFAEILGVDKKSVSEVVSGKRAITPEMAVLIGDALGTGPSVWLNLDNEYQLYKSAQGTTRDDSVSRRARLFGEYPVREMARRGWISQTRDVDTLEREIAEFALPWKGASRRVADGAKLALHRAWLNRAYQLAGQQEVGRYSEGSLLDVFDALKELRAEGEALRRIPGILREAGVRFLIVEQLQGSKIDGACFWLDGDGPVVALSLRYDRIDYFWFTLMHELYHARFGHGREEAKLDVDLVGRSRDCEPREEQEVNTAAAEFLVPRVELDDFIRRTRPYFSAGKIGAFSRNVGVHPGIVIGQLQHRGVIPRDVHRRALVKVLEPLRGVAMVDGWGAVAVGVRSN